MLSMTQRMLAITQDTTNADCNTRRNELQYKMQQITTQEVTNYNTRYKKYWSSTKILCLAR